jgi:hypothetical protein
MKNGRHDRLFEGLADDSPVRFLLDNLEDTTVDALVACCDQYMNAEMREAATIVARGGRIHETIKETGENALRASVASGSRGKWQAIQSALLRQFQRRGGVAPDRAESLLLAYFVAIECDLKRAARSKSAHQVLPHISGKHDRTSLLLGGGRWSDELARFLRGCDELARSIASQMTGMSEWHWFKAFVILHGANANQMLEDSTPLGFSPDDEDRIYECAERTIELETGLLERADSPFALAYREPFGAPDWDDEDFVPRSGFAARVALASLAAWTRAGPAGEHDIDPIDSLLRHLWRNDTAETARSSKEGVRNLSDAWWPSMREMIPKAETRNAAKDLAGARRGLKPDSMEMRACDAVEKIGGASEYQVSGDWRRSGGHNGAFARVIAHRNAIRIADRNLIRLATDRLATDDDGRFRDTVVVALAGKLAALKHEIWEPLTKHPRWSGKSHNGAPYQIEVIRQLAQKLQAPSDSLLPGMAKGIYLGANGQLREGFQWRPQPIAWRLLNSASHLEGEGEPGPWLWLYGTSFQAFVDRIIGQLASSEPAASDAQEWDRLLRFLFLVPLCKTHGADSRLADYAAVGNDVLLLAIRLLCGTPRAIRGIPFELARDLWTPATEPNYRVESGNALFAAKKD